MAAVVSAVLTAALVIGLVFGLQEKCATSLTSNNNSTKLTGNNWQPVSAFSRHRFAAVTSESKICSIITTEYLAKRGASSVDAAIVNTLCVGVVNAHSSGIGGGHFMTIYATSRIDPTKSVKIINAREMAPAAVYDSMFVNRTSGDSLLGGLAILVPGEIMGFYEAWKLYGKLPWQTLFSPAIDLCVHGFRIEKSLSAAIKSKESLIRSSSEFSELYLKPNGQLKSEGDLLQYRKLAHTLEQIAANPFDFYNGSLATSIVEDIRDHGGIITIADLMNYKAKVTEPVISYLKNGNLTVYGPPPPSSGAVFQYILNILDGFELRKSALANREAAIVTNHRIIESFKHAFAKRSFLGDEDYTDVTELLSNMTSTDYAVHIRKLIDDNRTFDASYYQMKRESPADSGTSHASICAADGSCVAVTSTINKGFGAMVIGRRTGIIFNNQMDNFITKAADLNLSVAANHIRPGKRPMSSMTPSLFINSNGEVILTIGASGGTRIITSSAYVAVNTLWLGKTLNEAEETMRLHHQLTPNVIQYQINAPNIDKEILEGLKQKGHTITEDQSSASVQAVYNLDLSGEKRLSLGQQHFNRLHAVADWRKGGGTDGF